MNDPLISLSHRKPEPEKSVLYIVGTPIGNLDDISKRVINILKNVSLIACEDTRITRKLLNHLKISNKLISFHKFNSLKKSEFILTNLADGNSIALVSDAGMPLISDPGDSLVTIARKENFDVICIPGPCAAIAALVSSGLQTSKFTFFGFIPKNTKERNKTLEMISNNIFSSIIYESPKRVSKLLTDLKNICGGDRKIAIFKEITKKYETYIGNTIDEAIKTLEGLEPKGEYTFIIAGKTFEKKNNGFNKECLKNDLIDLMKAGLSHSAASNYLAKKSGFSKNKIYNLIF